MHYFFLGNTPSLSLLELESLYPAQFSLVTEEIASYPSELDLTNLSKLGGVRKVALELAVVKERSLESKLIELIRIDQGGKNVAITSYGMKDLQPISLSNIKKAVSEERPIRFVAMDTSPHELIMLARQHVSEFNVLPAKTAELSAGHLDQKFIIAKTVWIYDASDWVSRDRSKPYRDIKRGMLPPKVARIMVNLATKGQTGLTLADPFCGTGTVLSEAMMVGCHVIGSDLDPLAVKGASSNLEWLASPSNSPLKSLQTSLYVLDATHFDTHVKSVDCIATEPYMGPLLDERNPSSLDRIKNIAKGLDKMYRGAFKAFHSVLPVGGRIVISLPIFQVYGKLIPTISVDSLTRLGYNYISAVPYSKPGAAVIRNITILEKK